MKSFKTLQWICNDKLSRTQQIVCRANTVKEQTGFRNTYSTSKRWCATLNPVWFIKIGLDSSETPLLAFKPISWLWRNTPPPSPLHSISSSNGANNTRLKPSERCSSFYGQPRLVDHCWSQTLPPSANHGPLSTWKAVWWARVRWWRWRPGRGSGAGDSGSEGRWGVTWNTRLQSQIYSWLTCSVSCVRSTGRATFKPLTCIWSSYIYNIGHVEKNMRELKPLMQSRRSSIKSILCPV